MTTIHSLTAEDAEDAEEIQKKKMERTLFKSRANGGRRAFVAGYAFEPFFLCVLRVLCGESGFLKS